MSDISNSQAIHQITLDWRYATTDVFSAIKTLPYAVLLDSADADHVDARYDILTAEPLCRLITKETSTLLLRADNSVEAEFSSAICDPLTLLQQQLKQFFPQPTLSSLPFSGGAMMALSYDLGRNIEKLPNRASNDIAFPRLLAGIYGWALLRDATQDIGQQWQLVSVREDIDLPALALRLSALVSKHLEQSPAHAPLPFKLTSNWQTQLSKAEYLQRFEQIQQYLHSGDCYQINLTQRFSAHYQGDEWQAYLNLREHNVAPFSAYWDWDDKVIISISPERFLKIGENRTIETKPIKGTAPRFGDLAEDNQAAAELQQSEKNRAENLMIVDLLRNDIGKVAQAGTVQVPSLFAIESFPAVHHLVSTVTATLALNHSATDLLRAAFPGGSITGAPKVRAMEIIDELEPSRRSIYCGSIGYISQDGKMDSSITIRTLLATEQQLYCWAGGGIVADSNGEAEYQESFDKVSKILPVLAN
ncbi:aminodeoxychorismate synthase component I [Shewanella avicenniae]|uniref:aminodeoxychorismate synthase n=1 Tax=Shewanella avicenniae TaxID=2814294 RepID=A0ABX7QKV6_9GAMM|nr:aminodeoxychorismate synthase component I [Shewanella avicenniae]QSX32019.1 aminodeoxychorismate synthase component I [Shewanella avicenniae]